jgi:hypothetical protein
MWGKIIKTGNRALFPLCEPLFGCEILDKGEMRPSILDPGSWMAGPVSVEPRLFAGHSPLEKFSI